MRQFPLITLSVPTASRNQLIDITRAVAQAAAERQVRSGQATVFVPHTTAAVTINENADPDVQHDLLRKLSELIPQREAYYQHNEGNSDSHVKSSLTGCTLTVLIEEGELVLGTWQAIYFCEFDGPRHRQVHLKLIAWD